MCELLHTGLARTLYGGEIAEQSVMAVGSYSYHRPLWAFPPYLTPPDSSGRGLFQPPWLRRTNVWRRATSPRTVTRDKNHFERLKLIDRHQHPVRLTILTPARSRRSKTPRCPRCKLRQSRPASACPSNARKRCTCCDYCRRDCALDANGSQLKRS